MQREITVPQLLSWLLALAGGATSLCLAFLLFVADKEQRAATFASGGLALSVWAAVHLTDRRSSRR